MLVEECVLPSCVSWILRDWAVGADRDTCVFLNLDLVGFELVVYGLDLPFCASRFLRLQRCELSRVAIATQHGSSCPLTKTADTQAALVLMASPTIDFKVGLSLLCHCFCVIELVSCMRLDFSLGYAWRTMASVGYEGDCVWKEH